MPRGGAGVARTHFRFESRSRAGRREGGTLFQCSRMRRCCASGAVWEDVQANWIGVPANDSLRYGTSGGQHDSVVSAPSDARFRVWNRRNLQENVVAAESGCRAQGDWSFPHRNASTGCGILFQGAGVEATERVDLDGTQEQQFVQGCWIFGLRVLDQHGKRIFFARDCSVCFRVPVWQGVAEA